MTVVSAPTSRARNKAKNKETQLLYAENIIESIPIAVITLNSRGCIQSFNKASEELLGVSREEVLNTDYSNIIPENEVPRMAKTIEYVMKTGRTFWGKDREFYTKSKRKIISNLTFSLVKDRRGKIQGIAIIVEDVTQQRKMEEYLQHSTKLAALGTMAVSVAHELRNPLSAIYGFASLLLNETEPRDSKKKFLEIIIEEAQRLTQVAQGLLEFGKPSSEPLQEVSLCKVFQKVLTLVAPEVTNREVKVKNEIPPDLPLVWGHPQDLQQAFFNILINALQSVLPSEGEITLKGWVDEKNNWIVIEISDNGKGIDSQDLPYIFDPFFSTKEKGIGLGLAITSRIITNHHGLIKVNSQPGAGTTFRIRLPHCNRQELLGLF